MHPDVLKVARSRKRNSAFTLVEVVVSLVIVATVFGGILVAYVQAARRAEWTGRSLAAEAYAIQQVEQARSARWDLTTGINELANIGNCSFSTLDLPSSGTNYVWATNYITTTMLTFAAPNQYQLRMITVDTVWPFAWRNTVRYFTNRTCTYCAPDN
jgi:prepilin-type N-terminal cleavage/methylation domain-containing protein